MKFVTSSLPQRKMRLNIWPVAVVAMGMIGFVDALPAEPTPAAARPAQPEIRFCPANAAWTYPLQDQRGLQSLLLQTVGIVNPAGADAFQLESVELQILAKGEVRETSQLNAADLAKAAAAAPQLTAFEQALPGQFCSGDLLRGAHWAKSSKLAANEALVLMQRFFAWRGERDTVRVIAHGTTARGPVTATADLPIKSGFSTTEFRFPLRGEWLVGAGPTLHSHHRWATMEQFAYDIVKQGEAGHSHRGDGAKFSDYYDYGAPVLAAADGTVVKAVNDVAEDASAMQRPGETAADYEKRLREEQGERMARGPNAIIGNHVVIDHGHNEFSIYAHLQRGSVAVKLGEKVKSGAEIGKLGSSGNSTEPHLHFQVCDSPDALRGASIPPHFIGIELPGEAETRALQTGDTVIAK